MVLLVMSGSLEQLAEAAADCFEPMHRIAGDDRTQCRTANNQHFMWNSFHHRAKRAAGYGKATEYHDKQDHDPDDDVHSSKPPRN